MTDDETSLRVRVVMAAIVVALTGFVIYEAGVAVVEQREQRIENCDDQYGDDQWVFVEKEQKWYEELMNIGGHGPVECVAIDSARAEDCVVGTTVADYNDRCADL